LVSARGEVEDERYSAKEWERLNERLITDKIELLRLSTVLMMPMFHIVQETFVSVLRFLIGLLLDA